MHLTVKVWFGLVAKES